MAAVHLAAMQTGSIRCQAQLAGHGKAWSISALQNEEGTVGMAAVQLAALYAASIMAGASRPEQSLPPSCKLPASGVW